MGEIISQLEDKSIKELTAIVSDKNALVLLLADKYDNTPRSVSNHWLNSYYSVPKKLEGAVKSDIIEFIKAENEEA